MSFTNKDYYRGYKAGYSAGMRRAYFEDKECARCGSQERLELDHIDRSTKEHHAIWNWAPERRRAELAKCQVLCKDCHLAKTIAEAPHTLWPHGTMQRYRSKRYSCRCDECRKASSAYERDRRSRKG